MRQETLTTVIEYLRLDELPKSQRELVLKAREATALSHSPYSHFCVGCAIRLNDKSIITGANQENASYGMSVCAERTTIFSIHNIGKKSQIHSMAVTARPEKGFGYIGKKPVAPCGACRQVIKESEYLAGSPILLLFDCYDDEKIARVIGIDSLLPLAFGPSDLT